MIAVSIMSLVVLALVRLFYSVESVSLNSRMQVRASRLADSIQTRYTQMFFGYILPVDSRKPGFGLASTNTYPIYSTGTVSATDVDDAWTNVTATPGLLPSTPDYPEMPVLKTLKDEVRKAGFSGFSIDVIPMRRDSTGITGMTSSLVPFADINKDGKDDEDESVAYVDLNGDGDQTDFFIWKEGGFFTSEQPNTHIVQLVVNVFKDAGTILSKRGQLLTMESLSGATGVKYSDEAKYSIILKNMPSTSTVTLFDRNNSDSTLQKAEDDAIKLNAIHGINIPYPAGIVAIQADSKTSIKLTGWTEAQSTVTVRLTADPSESPLTEKKSKPNGNFSFFDDNLNAKLVPGWNQFALRGEKGVFVTPFLFRKIILDNTPPKFEEIFPGDGATIHTLTPFVETRFSDPPSKTTTVVSGVCPESIVFVVNEGTSLWAEVHSEYSPLADGRVRWVDATTSLPPKLKDGTKYIWAVAGGDRAKYKVKTNDSKFKVSLLSDTTSPSADVDVVVSGGFAVIDADLNDSESGVNLHTFVLSIGPDTGPMKIVLDTSSPRLGQWFQRKKDFPGGALFHYTYPLAGLASGTYKTEISVENHQKIKKVASATFVIP